MGARLAAGQRTTMRRILLRLATALAGLVVHLGSALTLTASWRPFLRTHAHRRSVACNEGAEGADDGAEPGFDGWSAWDAMVQTDPPPSPEQTPPDTDDWNRWDARGATTAIDTKDGPSATSSSEPPSYDEDSLSTRNYERVLRQVTDEMWVNDG